MLLRIRVEDRAFNTFVKKTSFADFIVLKNICENPKQMTQSIVYEKFVPIKRFQHNFCLTVCTEIKIKKKDILTRIQIPFFSVGAFFLGLVKIFMINLKGKNTKGH